MEPQFGGVPHHVPQLSGVHEFVHQFVQNQTLAGSAKSQVSLTQAQFGVCLIQSQHIPPPEVQFTDAHPFIHGHVHEKGPGAIQLTGNGVGDQTIHRLFIGATITLDQAAVQHSQSVFHVE